MKHLSPLCVCVHTCVWGLLWPDGLGKKRTDMRFCEALPYDIPWHLLLSNTHAHTISHKYTPFSLYPVSCNGSKNRWWKIPGEKRIFSLSKKNIHIWRERERGEKMEGEKMGRNGGKWHLKILVCAKISVPNHSHVPVFCFVFLGTKASFNAQKYTSQASH